jgi:hypothetical protein
MKTKFFPISQGVQIVTIGSKKDRCTIGYRRVNRMIQVAVSYCAPEDKWVAKTGQVLVKCRLYDAIGDGADELGSLGVISLPLGKADDITIQMFLTGMFFGFDEN